MLARRGGEKKKKKKERKHQRGKFASFWKEKGGESMTQSTAARIRCILRARGDVEGRGRTMRKI